MANWDNPSATDGVTFLPSRSKAPSSAEGKMAAKINDAIDKQSFSVEFLARFMVYNGSIFTRTRLLQFCLAAIHALGQQNMEDEQSAQEARSILKKLSK